MIGSSVVPGLPNIFDTPSSVSTRRKASRPVMVFETRESGIGSPPAIRAFPGRHRSATAAAVK